MNSIWILRIITFLASFLLFQIQFIIGKIFLANFGGGYMVWGACMVFFQGALLVGYLYAHKILEKVWIKRYLFFHFFVLVVPVAFFPGRFLSMRQPGYGLAMVFDVFIRLLITIGPVFFALSTMSIICQAWLSSSELSERENPYALFSVSNFGSLLALLSYPFVFEIFFDLIQQQHIWRILYFLMVLIYGLGVNKVLTQPQRVLVDQPDQDVSCSGRSVGQWFFYSAAGVAFFLAVTNVVTAEIAPMPFLWMIPLAVYLLSYILNFKQTPWAPAFLEKGIFLAIAFGTLLYFFSVRQVIPVMLNMIFMMILVFFICMICQKRLYALRPDNRKLTFFYFIVSLGGFFGGMIVTWIIPLIFVNYAEYFLGMIFLLFAWFLEEPKVKKSFMPFFLLPISAYLLYISPSLLSQWRAVWFFPFVSMIFTIFYFLKKERIALLLSVVLVFIFLDVIQPRWYRRQYVYGTRSYYGINRVFDVSGIRLLIQGTTIHGAQSLDLETSFIPLAYYGPQSPAARILINEEHHQRIGMIGLGTGALAMYPRQNQVIDFYEIDRDVLKIANTFFSYLNLAGASINYIITDARIGLQENKDALYDVLVIDAFSGDSVPIHLLTLESLDLYRQRLKPKGVILFHLSNRYINLTLAFLKTVSQTDAFIALKSDRGDGAFFSSDWTAVTYDRQVFDRLVNEYGWLPAARISGLSTRPWTDKYSNIAFYLFHPKIFSSLIKGWDIR